MVHVARYIYEIPFTTLAHTAQVFLASAASTQRKFTCQDRTPSSLVKAYSRRILESKLRWGRARSGDLLISVNLVKSADLVLVTAQQPYEAELPIFTCNYLIGSITSLELRLWAFL